MEGSRRGASVGEGLTVCRSLGFKSPHYTHTLISNGYPLGISYSMVHKLILTQDTCHTHTDKIHSPSHSSHSFTHTRSYTYIHSFTHFHHTHTTHSDAHILTHSVLIL